jgi:hypothetical protein
MTLNPELGEVLRRGMDSRAADIFTSCPGRIVSYDSESQTADIAPVVRRAVPAGDESDPVYEDLPVVPNVPVIMPQGMNGTVGITWPLVPGDHGLILVSMWSFTGWRQTGVTSDPGDLRIHSLGNAVFLPGMAPNKSALPQAQINALVIEGPNIRLGKNASNFVALANLVLGNFTKIKNAFSAWVPVPNDGGAALKTVFGAVTFDDVSATKVKAE